MKLDELVERASLVLKEKKVRKTAKARVVPLDAEICIEALDAGELERVFNGPYDSHMQVKKLIYDASPDLQKIANELLKKGEIADYTDVVDIFSLSDRNALVDFILKLSGVNGEKGVILPETVSALKN